MSHVVFLSLNDFKDKSIQVIRKTPEYYAKKDFKVTFIVVRDNSAKGNYYYEKEIFPEGVNVIRKYMPLTNLYNKVNNSVLSFILLKLRLMYSVLILIMEIFKLKYKEKVDIIYGYEVHGVLAAMFIKPFLSRKTKYISRFQGTTLVRHLNGKSMGLSSLKNLESVVALKQNVDVVIMTNDGTKGDMVLRALNNNSQHSFFWVNGVDKSKDGNLILAPRELNESNVIKIITISRLVSWKRVDRVLLIIEALVKYGMKNIKVSIIGEGPEMERLIKMVEHLNINKYVDFIGSVKSDKVFDYLIDSDVFFSMYDMSNVGNPLLEAIRYNKYIFTLNNGDTSSWIKHKINGFIYDENVSSNTIAKDFIGLVNNKELQRDINKNIKETEKTKLWTWQERLEMEVESVKKLLIEDKNE